ncbi:1-Cys peroxiredoxin [Hondaea fermentalgiana]|uniref:1-Cys peroxiredoxin n=1 Tax=Hondaea fermentalgiana TaxID=2315210 RepID=A0A2R5GZC7_9STRA|nr:1-Cys peroxiredoxin [Hondaea fermentalgiana]|eukprot:GBG33384.1 1-Cys peroxiredoxin [Hondaea fermentalgiana]
MGVFVGEQVPDFTAQTTKGEISLHDYVTGSWCVLFAHPANFTPVCTTEFGMVSKLQDEFEARNCKILGLSRDTVDAHEAWIKEINETQETEVNFPVIADEDGEISQLLGVANARGNIVNRTLYIIDPNRDCQLSIVYPENTGRNFYEVLRTLDSLQLTSYHAVGTPANWAAGEDVVILPDVPEEKAEELFPKGFTTIKPYLRITPMPDLSEGPLSFE